MSSGSPRRAPGRAAAAVDQGRLWQHHLELAKIGGTPRGGVNRQALTAEDAEARARLVGWGTALGLTPRWTRSATCSCAARAAMPPRRRS